MYGRLDLYRVFALDCREDRRDVLDGVSLAVEVQPRRGLILRSAGRLVPVDFDPNLEPTRILHALRGCTLAYAFG